jgi:hypothetical protein
MAEPSEEIAGEDADTIVEETFEGPPLVSHPEPDVAETENPKLGTSQPEIPEPIDPPKVVRKQDRRYPPRSRDDEDVKDRHDAASGPTADNDSEGRARGRQDRTRNGGEASGPVPEVPEDLFEWPELKEPRPWDRSRETGWQEPEERGEETDPEGPEEKPPRS